MATRERNSTMNINRRSAIKTIGTLSAANVFIGGRAFGQQKATAFALIGDGAHPFDMIKTSLDNNIVSQTGITIDYTRDPALLDPATFAGYRMLIFSRAYIRGITDEQQLAIQSFVQNGGGALFLHNSTDLARPTGTPVLRDVIGGYWLQHSGNLSDSETVRQYRVTIANRQHPITQGVNDFVITGEHHYNQYDKDPRNVFLRSETIDGWSYNNIEGDPHYDERLGERGFGPSVASGWAYDYGAGRVCFMAQGHTLEVNMHEEIRKLQKNAALWVMKRI